MAHTIHHFTITSSAFLRRATAVGSDNLLNYDQSTTKIHMMTISSGTFGDWVALDDAAPLKRSTYLLARTR
eukprot:scaffold7819_cov88-Skeletonema_dohrnii-CCMP3373.AAC.1